MIYESNPTTTIEAIQTPTQDELRKSRFAKDVAPRIIAWLDTESPNSQNYLGSPAHIEPREWVERNAVAIEREIQQGLEGISMVNADFDLRSIRQLYSDTSELHVNQYNGKTEPLAKMHGPSDIAYAGIREAVNKAEHETIDAPIETINEDTVRAVGATFVRSFYFSLLSDKAPEVMTPERKAAFDRVYRQNILSYIRRSARLERQAGAVANTVDQPTILHAA